MRANCGRVGARQLFRRNRDLSDQYSSARLRQDKEITHGSERCLSVVIAVAGAIFPAWSQDNPVFPVIGIGPGQWLRLHAIALGTGQGRCQARLSFRNTANEDLGRSLQVDLTLGKSALIDYQAAERIEVRAVVEHL